jgi:hypothetical protein
MLESSFLRIALYFVFRKASCLASFVQCYSEEK